MSQREAKQGDQMDYRKRLGKFIRFRRTLRGISLRQMADEVKVSAAFLSCIERGLDVDIHGMRCKYHGAGYLYGEKVANRLARRWVKKISEGKATGQHGK